MPEPVQTITIVRVRYNECDSIGYAFNANFFIWMQDAAGDLYEAAGVDVKKIASVGQTFMAVHMACDFKRPIKFRDSIQVQASVKEVGESSLHLKYDIFRDDELMAVGLTIYAYVDSKQKSKVRIPEPIREKFLSAK